MGTQIVPECDVPFQFCGILRTDIQVMFLQMVFAVIFECFPSDNAKVSLITVTDFFQFADNLIKYRIIRDNDIYVNDRFCRQPGN